MRNFATYLKEQMDHTLDIDDDNTSIFTITSEAKDATDADFFIEHGHLFIKIFMQDPIDVTQSGMKYESIKKKLEVEQITNVYVQGFSIDSELQNGKHEIDDFLYNLKKYMQEKK